MRTLWLWAWLALVSSALAQTQSIRNPGGGGGGGGTPNDGTVTDIKVAVGAAIDPLKIGSGNVNGTEFDYLDGLTSNAQSQFAARLLKAGDTVTGTLTFTPGGITAITFGADSTYDIGTSSSSGRARNIHAGNTITAGGSTWTASQMTLAADGPIGRSGGADMYATTTAAILRSPDYFEMALDSNNNGTGGHFTGFRNSAAFGGTERLWRFQENGDHHFYNSTGAARLRVFGAWTDVSNGSWFDVDSQTVAGRIKVGSAFNGTGTALPIDFVHGFGTGATLQTNGTFNFNTVGVTNGITIGGAFSWLTDNAADIGQSTSAGRPRQIYAGTAINAPELRSGNGTVLATLDNAGEMQIPSLQITNSVDSTSESLSGTSPVANWAAQGIKTITLSGNTTFTFSNTPTGNGYVRSLAVKVLGNGSHTIAFPGTVDWQTSTIGTPRASDWTDYLFEYRAGTVYGYASDGGGLDADLTAVGNITGTGLIARAGDANWTNITTSAGVAAHITDETGTGAIVLATSPTITTPTISGAITFPDGVRQTFNPDGTAAGLNVGSQSGDPSSPTNGDLWYDSTANELTARINGANVALGAGGGSATYKPWDTNQYHLPSTTYHVGTPTSVPVNTMRCIAFFSEAGGKLTNISFSVTTGGSAGSVARIGVYNATSANDRRPGTLVVGSGEIDTTTTGHKVATVDVTLDPQKWYLLAILTGTAAPTLASSDPAAAYTMGFDPVNNGPVTYYQVTQTYGALPANAPTGGTMVVSAAQPKMFVKFSQSP